MNARSYPVPGRGRPLPAAAGTGLIAVALVATVAALLYPVWSYQKATTRSHDTAARTVATQYGPLTSADRDFVAHLRRDSLWELPAGQMAMQRGTSKAVRGAGEQVVKGLTALDEQTRQTAAKLGLTLPAQPAKEQRGWLNDLDNTKGKAYGTGFGGYMRRAEGDTLELTARIRNTTQNTLVRTLATTANKTALDQMTALEKSGLSDYGSTGPGTGATTKPTKHGPSSAPTSTPSLPPAWSTAPGRAKKGH